MGNNTRRRRAWRHAIAIAVLGVLVLEWPAEATGPTAPVRGECGYGPCGRNGFTAFNLEYFPKRQKTVGWRDVVDFYNADPMSHAAGGHTVTHLNEHGPPRFDTGVVPFGHGARVAGLEWLTPQKYLFYCKNHPFMKGKFWVIGGSIDVLPIAP
ncbi:MAG: cupredoxin domain-containing protein [Acidimicrobiia bacterium]